MRVLLQRVSQAAVRVDGRVVGRIGSGLVLFAAAAPVDTEEDLLYLADKVSHLRIFPDAEGRFARSLLEDHRAILLVSQFTLYADTRRGRRPSLTQAAPPEQAERLLDRFAVLLRETGAEVETGLFQAHMEVKLYNDGPVTILLDSADRRRSRRN